MKKQKGVFCIIGESFRYGLQGSRVRGIPESFHEQELATKSQLAFFSKIRDNIDIKIKLITYNTQYNDNLLEWFKSYDVESIIIDNPIGYDNLFNQALFLTQKENDIDFIFFLRIDLILKEKFLEVFNSNYDKIIYPSICWITSFLNPLEVPHHKTWAKNRHRINDLMLFIPKKFFNELYNGEIILTPHEACDIMSDYLYENVTFFLDTYHDSDTYKDRNPLYKVANRPETEKWYSEGYRIGENPILDDSKTYSNIFNNEKILI